MNPLVQPSPSRVTHPTPSGLAAAVLRTVAYADVFDCPLEIREIHRYLVGARASREAVASTVEALVPERLHRRGDYVFLPGREETVRTRIRRRRVSRTLWPRARKYALQVAALPFVRMVAITGSLARDHAHEGADVDLLVVAETGRLWVCRALVGLLARKAAREGVVLCANYFLSEEALELDERTVYTAHELLQMVPVAGPKSYRELRERNRWTRRHLPNASNATLPNDLPETGGGWVRRAAEAFLRTPVGAWLDRLERRRKWRRSLKENRDLTEARFDADCFKGHFDGHGRRTLAAYETRLATRSHEGGP